MKTIMINKYTTAHTAPIVSGSSLLCNLPISFPFIPAFIKVGPNHRIMAYDAEKAMPLSAREAIRGSPSPWKVFVITPRHARQSVESVRFSVKESAWEVIASQSSPSGGKEAYKDEYVADGKVSFFQFLSLASTWSLDQWRVASTTSRVAFFSFNYHLIQHLLHSQRTRRFGASPIQCRP